MAQESTGVKKYLPAFLFKDPASAQAFLSAGYLPEPEPAKPDAEPKTQNTSSKPQAPAASLPPETKSPSAAVETSKPVYTDPLTLISNQYISDAESKPDHWKYIPDMPEYEFKPQTYYDPGLKDYYDQQKYQVDFTTAEFDNLKSSYQELYDTYGKIESAFTNRFSETYFNAYHGDTAVFMEELKRAKSMIDNMSIALLDDVARLSAVGNKEQADELRNQVYAIQNSVNSMYSNAKGDADYWTQFKDEEEYGAYSFHQDMMDKHEGKSYESILGSIDDNYNLFASPYITGDMASDITKENKWLEGYGQSIATSKDYEQQLEKNNEKLEWLKQQRKALTTFLVDEETSNQIDMLTYQIDALKSERSRYESLIFYEHTAEYMEAMPEDLHAAVMQIPYYEYDKIKAAENSYVSFEESEKAYAARQALDDKINAVKDRLRSEGYTEDQIEDLVSYANLVHDEELYKQNIEEAEAYAKEHPFWASVKSVGENLMGGFGYIDLLFQNAKKWVTGNDTPINYYTPAMQFSGNAGAARSTVAASIDEAIDSDFLSNVATGLYQVGMSVTDTVTAVYGLGLGSAASYVLATSSAASGIMSAKERGATDGQALLFGTFSGLSDLLCDKIPVGDLFSMGKSGVMNSVKTVLNNQLKEASEEVLTTFANTFADAVIMGDKSQLNILIDYYMSDEDVSKEEASRKAFGGWLNGLLWDALGGAVSSTVMSGIDAAAGKMKANSQILSPVTVDALIELTSKLDGQIEFFNAAQSGELGLREPTLTEMATLSLRMNAPDSTAKVKDAEAANQKAPEPRVHGITSSPEQTITDVNTIPGASLMSDSVLTPPWLQPLKQPESQVWHLPPG